MDLSESLGCLLKQIHISSTNKLNAEIGNSCGITFPQFLVLEYLINNQNKKIFKKDIEKAIKLSHATTNGVLARLYKKECINFCSGEDKRFQQVFITKEGIKMHKAITVIFKKHESFMCNIFSEEEQKNLKEMLLRLLNRIENYNKNL